MYNNDYLNAAEREIMRCEYPNPIFSREDGKWLNLNGEWRFDFDKNKTGEFCQWYKNHVFSQVINVPFPWESKLSGIQDTEYLGAAWYEKDVILDSSWAGKQIVLKFGAVDWICKIFLNGEYLTGHTGGYTPFCVDLTNKIKTDGSVNKITVMVEDYGFHHSNSNQLFGKQGHDAPVGYNHTSGIWQTVFLEAYDGDCSFVNILAMPDVDGSTVTFTININNAGSSDVTADISYEFEGTLYNYKTDTTVNTGSDFKGAETQVILKPGENTVKITANIQEQKLWSAETPNLYEGTFSLKTGEILSDKVRTYFGQRKISAEYYNSNTYKYIYINNRPVFIAGLLDQGFWEDGLYTAPSDAALKSDISGMKDLGFNLIRKHIKVEDPRQYYWADKIGMYFWQDIPQAKYFNNDTVRENYENTLRETMMRNFNNPCIISYILFNETWGIIHDDPLIHPWMKKMYDTVKEIYPMMLVEDMSPCNEDHIQPTDLFTFHMYPRNFNDAKNFVDKFAKNLKVGSTFNFTKCEYEGEPSSYRGEPWLNSEYGGVASDNGDLDVSWCFKYQTVIQRLYQELNGYVYTEPYDVEYECNGFLNYDRSKKIFGYEETAYGGDMSAKYLNQPDFIGFYNHPIVKIQKGEKFTAELGAMNWSGNDYHELVLKWRFDGTDGYGRDISTGICGEMPVDFKPYTLEKYEFSFVIPNSEKFNRLAGTVTAWIEDSKNNIIAKNFTNIVIPDAINQSETQKLGVNSYAISENAPAGTGKALVMGYSIPDGMDIDALNNMRILAEISSVKPGMSQTAETEEKPSDVTVIINGVEAGTIYVPDAPRDIRGVLSLDNNSSSAGEFGYLLDLSVEGSLLPVIKEEMKKSGKIIIKYEIKDEAVNKNKIKLYDKDYGRYALNPTVLLNPDARIQHPITVENGIKPLEESGVIKNGGVSAVIRGNGGLAARVGNGGKDGYLVSVNAGGNMVTLSKLNGDIIKTAEGLSLGEGEHYIMFRLFDGHLKVFAGNSLEPVINVYDYSYSEGKIGLAAAERAEFRDITMMPETYNPVSAHNA